MAGEFHLSVVAPDKSVVEEMVRSVTMPGSEGYFGVLAGHVPLVAALKPGLLEFVDGAGTKHYVYIGGGFVEVQAGKTSVLADEGQRAHDIDVTEAEKKLEEARASLRGDANATMSPEIAVIELERAMNRVRAARQVRP